MFKLQRYFSLASATAIIVLTIALAFLFQQNAIKSLSKLVEEQNIVLSRSFANIIWPKYAGYVKDVSKLSGDALRGRKETADIHATLKGLAAGLPVLKVKMYSIEGLTIYSSEFTQIGSSKKGNLGFEETVRQGKPSTKNSFRETFLSFDGQVVKRHLIESYLPIHGSDGQVEGVFELYADVTAQMLRIKETTTKAVVYLLVGLGILYGVLYLIVRHADSVLKRQYLDLEHEIIERKIAEHKYREAKEAAEAATRAKSEFLANMSHDLRTPLNAIIGFSDVINRQCFGAVKEKYQEYAKDIKSSGEHLLSLVNDILDLSAIESGKMSLVKERIFITDVVAECNVIIKERALTLGVDLETEVPDDLSPLYADKRAIVQILINLLSNAIKFTPEGGKVTLRVTATSKCHTIEVNDTGVGIPADMIPTITSPFVKGETDPHKTHESTGLGLAIVKSLVDLHDGELDIKSIVDVGTTVLVTLPNGIS